MRKPRAGSKPLWLWAGLALALVAAYATGTLGVAYERTANLAAVFFVDSSTPKTLQRTYAKAQRGGEKFKVLIVPGHDNEAWGTEHGGLREADLNLALGKLIADEFEADRAVEARLARTALGYDPDIARYFSDRRADILAYSASQAAQMEAYKTYGQIQTNVTVDHTVVSQEVALKLYGINKWANEEGYDLIIHVHFNDMPRYNRARPGPYTGFAIYVPERQYSNAKGSMAVAQAIQARLQKVLSPSSYPGEAASPVEDQDLIAIGSNNSLDAASLLIEYAYIYEPMVQYAALREPAFARMAEATYEGVEDFLRERSVAVLP